MATAEALDRFLLVENPDIVVTSDGSGTYDSGIMASACWVSSGRFRFSEYAVCGATCGNTIRSELSGVLLGFRRFYESLNLPEPVLQKMGLRVLVFCDNKFVVTGINDAEKRNAERDLWLAFSHYETIYKIEAHHVPREVGGRHKVVDALASNFRSQLKEFFETSSKP